MNPRRRRRLRFQKARTRPCLRCEATGHYFSRPWYMGPLTRLRCGVCGGAGALRPDAGTVYQNYEALFRGDKALKVFQRFTRPPLVPKGVGPER